RLLPLEAPSPVRATPFSSSLPDGGGGGGGGEPPSSVWPGLQLPKLDAAGFCQLKSAASLPLPASCREWPSGVLVVSATPTLLLVMPAAAPSLAVNEPS